MKSVTKKLPNVILRTASAAVLAPVVLSAIYFGGAIYSMFLGVVLSVILYEAINIYSKNSKPFSFKKLRICFAMSLFVCFAIYFLYLIRSSAYGFEIIIWLIMSVWVCDIFAYLSGNIVGGPKILPSVSPSKTWSGFIGGASATVVFSLIYQNVMNVGGYNIVLWSFFLGVVAHLGDFIESYYKRVFGVKDSGNIIPGHGGLLDRFDSILSTACFVILLQTFS